MAMGPMNWTRIDQAGISLANTQRVRSRRHARHAVHQVEFVNQLVTARALGLEVSPVVVAAARSLSEGAILLRCMSPVL